MTIRPLTNGFANWLAAFSRDYERQASRWHNTSLGPTEIDGRRHESDCRALAVILAEYAAKMRRLSAEEGSTLADAVRLVGYLEARLQDMNQSRSRHRASHPDDESDWAAALAEVHPWSTGVIGFLHEESGE